MSLISFTKQAGSSVWEAILFEQVFAGFSHPCTTRYNRNILFKIVYIWMTSQLERCPNKSRRGGRLDRETLTSDRVYICALSIGLHHSLWHLDLVCREVTSSVTSGPLH
ncbi:hypothetical protein KCU59_g22, partial [Aureobasidium melanogenum]